MGRRPVSLVFSAKGNKSGDSRGQQQAQSINPVTVFVRLAGGRFFLEAQRPHRLGGRRFPFVVAWSKSGPGGGEIGCAFATEITAADAEALIAGP